MKTIVKMDEKGRIQIPKKIRRILKLKSKQLVFIETNNVGVFLKKAEKPDESKDKLIRDILIKPARSKIKVNKELLDKLEEEAWTA